MTGILLLDRARPDGAAVVAAPLLALLPLAELPLDALPLEVPAPLLMLPLVPLLLVLFPLMPLLGVLLLGVVLLLGMALLLGMVLLLGVLVVVALVSLVAAALPFDVLDELPLTPVVELLPLGLLLLRLTSPPEVLVVAPLR